MTHLRITDASLVHAGDTVLTEGPFLVLFDPRTIQGLDGRDYISFLDVNGRARVFRADDSMSILTSR